MTARLKLAATLALALASGALVAVSAGVLPSPLSWVVVAGSSMEPALAAGDVAFVLRQRGYAPGDAIAYRVPPGEPGAGLVVIHRIVGGSETQGYVVKRDNKPGIDPWLPRPRDVVGKQVFAVPRLGLAVGFLRTPLGLALVAGLVAAAVAAAGSPATRGAARGFTSTLPRA